MIKAVISDLDGTLLNGEHKISEATQQAVEDLVAKGIKFVIATGRHHCDVAPIVDSLGGNFFYITSNGARVHDKEGNVFHSEDLAADIVEDLITMSRGYDVHVNIYDGDDWYVEKPRKELLGMHPKSNFIYKIVDFAELNHNTVSKVFFLGDNTDLLKLEAAIHERHPEKVSTTFSLSHLLEVMTHGVNKGKALKKVLEHKNIEPNQAIAFGDGLNDLEMLNSVEHRVVMANANRELKLGLDTFHQTKSNTEDGVAHFLREFLGE